jgi:exosortase
MLPLPHRLEVGLAQPLQRIASTASTYVLQTLGFAAFSEGNLIRMGEERLNVVEACSGLSMLMIFFALSTAVVLVTDRSLLEKSVIFASAIPIALISNIARIVVTGVMLRTVGSDWADFVFHDLAGYLMPLLALALLWVELQLLSRIFVDPPTFEAEFAGLGAMGLARQKGMVPRQAENAKRQNSPKAGGAKL